MKPGARLIILVMGLLILPADAKAMAPPSEKAQQAYARANALFVEKKFAESLAALNQALAENPEFVPALTLRAKLAMAMDRLEPAGRDLKRAVELEPGSAYNQFMLGFYYYLENDFKRALEPLERARTLDPSSSRTHFYLALTHEGLANADLAIQMYERALSLAGSSGKADTDVLIAYARLLFTLGQYSKSMALVDQALVVEPDSRDAHYERGTASLSSREI